MNREIKFRAWDGVDYMSNPFTLSDLMNDRILFTSDTLVMQFTGITDKNGVDVYEGDIMQHENPFDVPFVVNWDENSLGFVFNYGSTSYVVNDTSFTVIGNIYENPELLNL
jgi:YopX protein